MMAVVMFMPPVLPPAPVFAAKAPMRSVLAPTVFAAVTRMRGMLNAAVFAALRGMLLCPVFSAIEVSAPVILGVRCGNRRDGQRCAESE